MNEPLELKKSKQKKARVHRFKDKFDETPFPIIQRPIS